MSGILHQETYFDAGSLAQSGVEAGLGTMNDQDLTYIGHRSYWGNDTTLFGIKTADRRQHIYTIGKTGSGKTTLLRNLLVQHIEAGHGIALIDPHGDLAEELLEQIPPRRTDDVVYFDPSDLENPVGLNLLANVAPDERHLVASGIVSAFKSIWRDSWGPRMEYILHNSLTALLDCQNTTLLGVNRLLIDARYRDWVVKQIRDPFVKSFWTNEFANYDERFLREAISPIQNKIGQFLTNAPIRNILGQVRSKIDLRFTMDDQRIFIANLTQRDVEILRHVSKHRLLTSGHVRALVGGSSQNVLRRLQLLFQNGYLDRPRCQIEYFKKGSKPIVYALAAKGHKIIDAGLATTDNRRSAFENRSLTRLFLEHTLAVADFMVALEVECRIRGDVRIVDQTEILANAPEKTRKMAEPFKWNVRLPANGHITGVIPDKIFGLEFDGDADTAAYFFLEADRATMPVSRQTLKQTSFARKLLAYHQTWKTKQHSSHFGINRFRVLTVTTSQERMRHMIEEAKRLGVGNGIFLFTTQRFFHESKTPLGNAWHTFENQVISLAE